MPVVFYGVSEREDAYRFYKEERAGSGSGLRALVRASAGPGRAGPGRAGPGRAGRGRAGLGGAGLGW
ncbi:hypothetical protein J2S43_004709 [Catenuloplanes nepalensis]|uniref:Uncharacterized protein n=1 Tax=Catenuloplanes nepalensis TaxID=587533 RepID=A0ABT9MXN0_9ACTN|nr:hypothetical protein [Catenuloplanes nepalensis]